MISQTINNYIWSIYGLILCEQHYCALSVNLLHSIPVITLALPTRGSKESQTHCFEDLLGSQHTLSCRRKIYKSSVYTFMLTAYTAPLSKFHCVHLTVCIAYLPSLVAIITDIRAVGSFQSHKEAVAFYIVLK